jgi:hypothetical protein
MSLFKLIKLFVLICMHDLIFKCHVTAQQLPGLSGVNEIQTQKQIKSNDLFEAELGFGSINKRPNSVPHRKNAKTQIQVPLLTKTGEESKQRRKSQVTVRRVVQGQPTVRTGIELNSVTQKTFRNQTGRQAGRKASRQNTGQCKMSRSAQTKC